MVRDEKKSSTVLVSKWQQQPKLGQTETRGQQPKNLGNYLLPSAVLAGSWIGGEIVRSHTGILTTKY